MSNPLHRHHLILHAVAGSAQGLSLPQLAAVTGLPRSTTHRMAMSLRDIAYLDIDVPTGNYVLGSAMVHLVRNSLTQDNKLEAFTPALNFIAGRLEETAFFARFLNNEVRLMKAVTPSRKDQLHIYPGVGNRPLDKCSSSKAILAYMDREAARSLLRLAPHDTAQSPLDFLLQELDQVNAQGFAVCDGDLDEGVCSIACPVLIGNARGLYSIGVVGLSGRLKTHGTDEIVSVLKTAAELAATDLLSV